MNHFLDTPIPFPTLAKVATYQSAPLSVFHRPEKNIRKEGKELAKYKPDFREGRPKKFNQQQINLAMNLLKNHSYKEVEKMTGISKSTLTRNNRKMQNKPQIGV